MKIKTKKSAGELVKKEAIRETLAVKTTPDRVELSLSLHELIVLTVALGMASDETIRERISSSYMKPVKNMISDISKVRPLGMYASMISTVNDIIRSEDKRERQGYIPIESRLDYFMAVNFPEVFDDEDIRENVIDEVCTGEHLDKVDGCGCNGKTCRECWETEFRQEEANGDEILMDEDTKEQLYYWDD